MSFNPNSGFKIPSTRPLHLKQCGAGWRKLLVLAASGFGFGASPIASGTFGTIPGIAVWLGLASLSLPVQIVSAAIAVLLAVFLCDFAEKHFGMKDDPRITADEYLTFPICMLGLPTHAWVVALAFLSHRAFDILKPPPARRLQDLPGGIGIVVDDVISSLYSLLANHAIYGLFLYWSAR